MPARNPFEPRPVKSRRGGPVKEPLSRDAIVRAALDVLLRDGLEGMTLRKVAAALDTGAASLYAYVEDQRELQALVLDRALGSVQLQAARGKEWRQRLTALLESYYHALERGPGLAQLALSTTPAGPNALRIMEACLELLDEAGVDPAAAAWAVDLILLYVTAIAAEQSHRRVHGVPTVRLAEVIAAVSPAEFPRIHALGEQLVSGSGLARFNWAIESMIQGFLRAPRPAAGGEGPVGPVKPRRTPSTTRR